MENFKHEYDNLGKQVNDYLINILDKMDRKPETLFRAMEYSLFAGGKRLRPIILLATTKLLEGSIKESLPLAGALEMIHTYSLIHDDLPSMDNDDFRRGKPTSHRKFGEGMAILAGDSLLNLAYETMLDNALLYPKRAENHLRAISVIGQAAGPRGMIGGQVVDLESQEKLVDEETLKYIHDHKTGSLFLASILAPVMLEAPDLKIEKALRIYGKSLGLAFQIVDDILDVVGNDTELGKTTGGDETNNKATYVDKYGLDGSWSMAKSLCSEAQDNLSIFGSKGIFLKNLAKFIIDRRN